MTDNTLQEFSFGDGPPAAALGTNLRTLVCEFLSFEVKESKGELGTLRQRGSPGRDYFYLYTGDRDVKAGDLALCHNGADYGLTRINRVLPGIHDKVTKTVITVVTSEDMKQYYANNKGIDNYRRIFDQLDGMLAEETKIDRYRKLAERNEQAAELLRSLGLVTTPSPVNSSVVRSDPGEQDKPEVPGR